MVWVDCPTGMVSGVPNAWPPPAQPPTRTTKTPRRHTLSTRTHRDRMNPSWQQARYLTSDLSTAASGTLMAMRRVVDGEWEPTVPALVQLVAATGAPHLRAAFAAAGLDGIRPAQSVALVPLVAGGLHASDLADRLRVSRQAVAQAVAALERHGYVARVPDPADARARIIELTPRGRQVLRVMRSSALDLEKRWQEILGQKRLGELRKILQTLLSAESPKSAG